MVNWLSSRSIGHSWWQFGYYGTTFLHQLCEVSFLSCLESIHHLNRADVFSASSPKSFDTGKRTNRAPTGVVQLTWHGSPYCWWTCPWAVLCFCFSHTTRLHSDPFLRNWSPFVTNINRSVKSMLPYQAWGANQLWKMRVSYGQCRDSEWGLGFDAYGFVAVWQIALSILEWRTSVGDRILAQTSMWGPLYCKLLTPLRANITQMAWPWTSLPFECFCVFLTAVR